MDRVIRQRQMFRIGGFTFRSEDDIGHTQRTQMLLATFILATLQADIIAGIGLQIICVEDGIALLIFQILRHDRTLATLVCIYGLVVEGRGKDIEASSFSSDRGVNHLETAVTFLFREIAGVCIALRVLGHLNHVQRINTGIAIADEGEETDFVVGGSRSVQPHTQLYYRHGVNRAEDTFVVLFEPQRNSSVLFGFGGCAIERSVPACLGYACLFVEVLKTLYGGFATVLHVIERHVVLFRILLRCPVNPECRRSEILDAADLRSPNERRTRAGAADCKRTYRLVMTHGKRSALYVADLFARRIAYIDVGL